MTKTFEKLSASYARLSSLEQAAIQMLSIIYEPTNQTALLNCLRSSGIRLPEGRILDNQDVKAAVSVLRKRGFIRDQLVCHPAFVEEATTLAVESGLFPVMVKAVHAQVPAQYWGNSPDRCIREVRIKLYSHDSELDFGQTTTVSITIPVELISFS